MRKVAFISEKGGVGKSTLCLNIAAVLGQEIGRRVLIVDLDGNACVSRTLADQVTHEDSMVAVLGGLRSLRSIVRPTFVDGVSIAPGSIGLRSVELLEFDPTPDGRVGDDGYLTEEALALSLAELSDGAYAYVFVDCPGGHPFMERSVLLACDEVIVPTGPAIYDLYALAPTIQMVAQAREVRGDGKPCFLGFLPNESGRQGLPKGITALLTQFGAPLFSPVRASNRLKTSPGLQNEARRIAALSWPDTALAASIRQVAREIDLGIEAARPQQSHDPETSDAVPGEVSSGAVAEPTVPQQDKRVAA